MVLKDGHFDYGAGLPHLDTPVLSVIGRGDKLMAHWDGARNWFDALNLPNGECWLTERADGTSQWQPDHMSLVTDPRSKPEWQRIERWLNSAVSPLHFRSDDAKNMVWHVYLRSRSGTVWRSINT